MNEKYTYGYNFGWNVENEHINYLKTILVPYNNQTKKIDGINDSLEQTRNYINKESNNVRLNKIPTDEQIREWYNEDYVLNGSLKSFEKYKEEILELIKLKNERIIQEENLRYESIQNSLPQLENEYFANLKYLIDVKHDTILNINQKKNELELLLSEKQIELSYIQLERLKTKPQYDENRNVINSEQLQSFNKRYNETRLEIQKIEHALQEIKNILNLLAFTQEETNLMMRGLNLQQKKIYEEIKKQKLMFENESQLEPVKESNIEEESQLEPVKELDPEGESHLQPKIIDENKLTLDGIIEEVCGDEKFNDSQSSRYQASKIRVFSKPQKDNLGLSYKIVSIPRRIVGIVPKTAMKIYGLFISEKTKQIFKGMEDRANSLTDDQVEVLLKEYKGAVAQSKRLPKGFNNAVRPRVDKYVSMRVAKINENINQKLNKINYCEKVIKTLKERLATEKEPEMINRINEVLDVTYINANECIKDFISLQLEGNNLQSGTGLHSFEEELKALDTKLNYVGGRFSKNREYDPKLWSKISAYSHKIEYGLDPKEVVEAYIAREQIYKENTKEKRSLLNLGSKVTTGKLDYRPFVESLNYGNDPYMRDLITSILVVSSAASLVNNIINNVSNIAKQNAIIEDFNTKIIEHNKTISDNQQFINDLRNSGDTIEKGIIYDIKQAEGAIENLGERGIGDKYDWSLSGKEFTSEDIAHHIETSNLSLENTNAIMDLSNKYSNGAITHVEYIKAIQSLKDQTTGVYQSYVENLHTYIENYAQSHPQYDYTAILSALKHALNNPKDSVQLTDFVANLYEKSLNVSDVNSLDLIEKTVTSHSLVPDILTLGAVTAKISQEHIDSGNHNQFDYNRSNEIKSMIEDLRAMKAELTEEDIKQIEELLTK